MSGAIGSILTNSGALAALNGIASAQQANTNYQTQLSSGKSINSPADNPAGYIQAQGFTSQLNGITQAISNANEGVSLLQTAQGAVSQQLSIAQKLNSIAVQAANGTQTPQESQSLQGVVNQLTSQITTISQQTQFNNINLLDGTFSGVQFQVGANEGQTISLSIGSTAASNLGMYSLDTNATSGSALFATGSSGAFSKGAAHYNPGASTPVYGAAGAFGTGNSITVTGSNGTSTAIPVSAAESAKSIADSVNEQTNTTNVAAQATTSATVTLATSSSYNFTLGNGSFQTSTNNPSAKQTNAINVNATSVEGVIQAINAKTAVSGVTAQAVSGQANQIKLTQASGANITILNKAKSGAITQANVVTGQTAASAAASSGTMLIQGKVSFQSDAAFAVSGAKKIGLDTSSNATYLSSINVSTTAGANKAINVVKYAIEGLNNLGGQLGASQQRLQATLNNLTTTSTNLNNGLATVQDANIPQVSQKLTQTQIQAQAGVAALKSSSTLQQAYLSLLP